MEFTVCVGEPDVTHGTSWLERTGEVMCGLLVLPAVGSYQERHR